MPFLFASAVLRRPCSNKENSLSRKLVDRLEILWYLFLWIWLMLYFLHISLSLSLSVLITTRIT